MLLLLALVDAANKHVAELVTKMKHQDVIALNDRTFEQFITQRPREYYAVVMLTAQGDQYGCEVCSHAAQVLKTAASATLAQVHFATTPNNKRIAFFLADYDACPNLFRNLKVNTVPRTYILPPAGVNDPKSKIADYAIREHDLLSAASLLDAIYSTSGIRVSSVFNPLPVLAGLIVTCIGLAYLVDKASSNPSAALLWYRSPYLWCLVSLVLPLVITSVNTFTISHSFRFVSLWVYPGRSPVSFALLPSTPTTVTAPPYSPVEAESSTSSKASSSHCGRLAVGSHSLLLISERAFLSLLYVMLSSSLDSPCLSSSAWSYGMHTQIRLLGTRFATSYPRKFGNGYQVE